MTEEYEMEEFADMAVEEFRMFIDTESQLVAEEHSFRDKIESWDSVLGHLDELIPAEEKKFHILSAEIIEKLIEIKTLLELGELAELKFIKEEQTNLKKLSSDISNIEHRNWQAVKQELGKNGELLKTEIRARKEELKQLHSHLIELMKIIKQSKLVSVKNSNLAITKEKEEYTNMVEYYFQQIYKFLRAYERIFRHLIRKEGILKRIK